MIDSLSNIVIKHFDKWEKKTSLSLEIEVA